MHPSRQRIWTLSLATILLPPLGTALAARVEIGDGERAEKITGGIVGLLLGPGIGSFALLTPWLDP